MASLSLFTNWAVGVINGYKQKENGLPNGIKYGTMGLTTAIGMFKGLGNFDTPTLSHITAGQKLFGVFVAVPIVIGANFCVGHHMGKAIRWAEDDSNSGKGGVRIKLL